MRRVLVIDDQPLEGEMIELILRRERPDAVYCGQALNASDGIRMAASAQPDLIFLDIRMPGMDGLSAIAPLRAACPEAQIVMLTAFDDFSSLRSAMRAGTADYLLKPIRPADILGALDACDRKGAMQAAPSGGDDLPAASAALTDAVRLGDRQKAEAAAQRYLAVFGELDETNVIHVSVRCMEWASGLAAQPEQPVDGLTYYYQEFVRAATSAKKPDQLAGHFCEFVRKAAELYGHAAGDVAYLQVARAKEYVSEHFHEALLLSDVAQSLYLSTAYFSRLFKEKAGMTFSDYLAQVRIDHARRLLATTDLSIAEVAAAIGYQEANSFSRLFKTRTGVSPSDYRAAQHQR